MLAHPTLDQLNTLGLYGLAKGFKELEHKPEARNLDHAEWLGPLLEYETTLRRQKQFETRARGPRLRHVASVEDVNYQSPRGLDRALFLKLAACDWIAERRNLHHHWRVRPRQKVGSPARSATKLVGKTCPFSTRACPGCSPTSPSRMAIHATPGCCAPSPAKSRRLLDDWGPEALSADQARDLLEIVEDRYDKRLD